MRIASSTYRLQLGHEQGFSGALELVGYLHELGITDCYLSPILAAAPGSTHGYDVVDHGRTDPALGTEAELIAFATELRERDMGLIFDVVPNHMCISSPENYWWTDVLENGPSSPFARYFDIDWDPPKADLKAKVLLPILGDQFGRVLERGEIAICYEGETFVAAYHEKRLPIAPRTWTHLLEPMIAELRASSGERDPRVEELESIVTSLEHLPLRTETDRAKVRERQREKEIAKRRLAALAAAHPEVKRALDHAVASINGTPDNPASVDRLEALLADQGYRPSFWRVASDEINYRRFFDINELAAIRVEEPAVFRAVHAIPLRLARLGLVTGLRIDHVDGLLSPRQYLHDLQRAFGPMAGTADLGQPGGSPPVSPGGSPALRAASCYVVVEKILSADERLPREWPVQGTTGYEVAALLTGVQMCASGVDAVHELYQAFTGSRASLADVIYESKKLVLRSSMSSELTVLARKLDDISEQHRTSRDFTLNSLQEALGELVACFPVYRTYVEANASAVSAEDWRQIELAIARAKRRNPATSASIYDFLRGLLLLEHPDGLDDSQLAARRDFVLRFQQLTSPTMAKGLEDTAFYRHVPLVAVNEVGAGGQLGTVTIEKFHTECARRAIEAPFGLSATGTHDTKRGEDTRARLGVLSELPALWRSSLVKLAELARPHKPSHDLPDANEEYLLYQTLVGAWPGKLDTPDATFVARIQQYMNKALKEAKVHSSWINPNEPYERDVQAFIATLLDPAASAAFLAELASLRETIAYAGYFNALSQVVLKIGVPGVPDFYQGSELWDLSLVDPDNRLPVDFALRRRLLAELRRASDGDPVALVEQLLSDLADGRIKMFVTMRGLAFRRAHRDVFERGSYEPLAVSGDHGDRVIAFTRSYGGRGVIVVCGRHFTAIAEPPQRPVGPRWGATSLELGRIAGSRFRDALTGRTLEASARRTLELRDVFAQLPMAMLEAVP